MAPRPAVILANLAALVKRHFIMLKSDRPVCNDALRQSMMNPSVCSTRFLKVPRPAHTPKSPTFGSVISSGVVRAVPLIVIFTVVPFADSDAGTTDNYQEAERRSLHATSC